MIVRHLNHSYFFKKIMCLSLVGGPIFDIACILCYKNLFNPSMLRPFMKDI